MEQTRAKTAVLDARLVVIKVRLALSATLARHITPAQTFARVLWVNMVQLQTWPAILVLLIASHVLKTRVFARLV